MNSTVPRTRPLICSLLVLTALAGCDQFVDAGQRIERGETLLEAGQYNEALVEIKNALADEPGSARARLALARTHLQLGQFDAADKALDEARAAGADVGQCDSLRAEVMLARGRPGDLLQALDGDGLELSEEQSRNLRIRSLAALSRCEEAMPLAREALASPGAAGVVRVSFAECLVRRGNTAAAITELEHALQEDPRNATAQVALGGIMQMSGRTPEAEAAWTRAAKVGPGQLSVPQLVVLYSALSDAQVARADLEGLRATRDAVLESAPGSGLADYLGANVALLEGKTDVAVSSLQKLLVANRGFRPARVLLASALLAQGKLEQARQEVHTLVREAPEVPNYKAAGSLVNGLETSGNQSSGYWVSTAGVHAALGQPAMARAALARALDIEPGSRDALLAQAQLELRMGNREGAARLAADLATRFPEDAGIRRFEADARAAAGDFTGAAAALEAASSRAPSGALAVAAYRLRLRGGLADPLRPLEQWLAANPDDRSTREQYAEALRAAGNHAAAIRELEKVVAQQPDHVGALNNLAWLYHLQRDPRALSLSRRAWERAPRIAEVADTYGWLLVESGSVAEGLEVLAKADAAAGMRQPEIRFHYAAALARTGSRDRAAALLKDLLANGGPFSSQAQAAELLRSLGGEQST
jgi:tetratricopeptide (TPR) repeat protein